MNSRGGFRRSGSLPPMSRVSMGRPSIGCGPQRVPSAMPMDTNVPGQSGGGFGSSMKRFGSVSAINVTSGSKQSRMSTAGSSGLTVIKDTRQFGDKMYRERMIRQLVEFLSSHGYPHAISLKGANGPSSGDFKKIFEFMVGHLQLDYKLNGKLEEEVPRVLKSMGYPVTISHSHMRTIGVPSTWVVLLGALSYLRTAIETVEQVEVDKVLFGQAEDEIGNDGKVKSQLYYEFVENCYQNFLAGNDDEIVKIRDQFMLEIENASVPVTEVQALEDEVKHGMEMLATLQSAPNEAAKLLEEVSVLEVDAKKMARYTAELERYLSDLESQLRASEANLQIKVAEKNALEADIQRKAKILSEQRISGCDAQRLNSERMALKAKLVQAEKAMSDTDDQLAAAEKQLLAEQEAVNAAVSEFNSKARLLQLIPSTAECAEGIDLEMRTFLTVEESTRFESVIRPGLHLVLKQQMEKRRQLEEHLQQTHEALRHFDDVITQHTDELASLVNTVTTIDAAAEQSKQVHTQEMMQIKNRMDELQQKMASCRQQGAVVDARRRWREVRESWEQEKSKLQAEEDSYGMRLINLSQQAVALKEKVKKMLHQAVETLMQDGIEQELDNDIREMRALIDSVRK